MKKIILFLSFLFIILILLSFNSLRVEKNNIITVEEDIKRDWKKCESISPFKGSLYSHTPGNISRDFEDWSESEKYLGIEIPNPLEDCDWLRNTTYLGEDLKDLKNILSAPHIVASGWGDKDGVIKSLGVESGYKNDKVRVTVGFIILTDLGELKYPLGEMVTEEEWLNYLENTNEIKALIDTGIYNNEYVSTAYQVHRNMKVHIQVRAEKNLKEEVDESMNKILDMFIEVYKEDTD